MLVQIKLRSNPGAANSGNATFNLNKTHSLTASVSFSFWNIELPVPGLVIDYSEGMIGHRRAGCLSKFPASSEAPSPL
jgi:hypothetical protein